MMLDVMQRARSLSPGNKAARRSGSLFAGAPVPYSLKYKPKVRTGGREIGKLARQLCRAVLVDRDMVDIAEAQACIHAGNTRSLARETRPNA